jgi:hypothetical protein
MNRQQRRKQRKIEQQIVKETAARQPDKLSPVDPAEWPVQHDRMIAVWASKQYLVQVYAEDDGVTRISICRAKRTANGQWADRLTWDTLQQIKADVGFADRCAVEVYPAEQDVVNVANFRHLWVLPVGMTVGWLYDGKR